jgi:hypothetical protein
MKKSIILICTLLAGYSLMAQKVVLNRESHAFGLNEENHMKIVSYVDPGSAGENQLWDLSELSFTKDLKGTVVESFTEDIENIFPESNIVLNEFGNRFFFRLEENSLKNYGMISKDGNYSIKFDKPCVKMKYPFQYGDLISGDYNGSIRVSGNETPLHGVYRVMADGYGKLILPDGIEISNTLRVRSFRSYKVESQNPYVNEIITYRWYTLNARYPVAVVQEIKNTIGGKTSVTRRAAYKDNKLLSDVNQSDNKGFNSKTKIYPNPAAGKLTIDYSVESESDVLIELYSNDGKKLATLLEDRLPSGNFKIQLDTDEHLLSYGTYHIRTLINGKTEVLPFIKL